MKLRDYQQAAVEAVIENWKTHRKCLIVLPTGCGKTVVFGEVIRRRLAEVGSHAMILAHREELIQQAKEKVTVLTGATADVEMGSHTATQLFGEWPPVIVSSVQTQITGRMNKFDPDDFATLVIDEAHHATAKSYRTCIDHYLENPCCRLLGVTATPDRADETALGNIFDSVAYEYSVDQAIHDGWLVPVKQKLVEVSSLDYSQVSTTAGDLNQRELNEVLEEEANLHGIASPTLEICGSRRAIVFTSSVVQAERLAEIFNRSRPNAADWICGKTPKEERKTILDNFKSGKIQFMVNVGVLTEGFDDAGVEVVVMARPTKSRALYAQMAGRATRPAAEIAAKLGEVGSEVGSEVKKLGEGEQWTASSDSAAQPGEATSSSLNQNSADHCSPSPHLFTFSPASKRRALIAASSKPSCLIIDFVGNSGRHKLVSMVDILGGKDLDEDEEAARAIVRKKCETSEEGLDAAEELSKAREEIKRNKEELRRQRSFIKITAKYRTQSVDPFNVFDLPPVDPATRSALDCRTATFKQRRIVRELIGVDPDKLRYSQIKNLLDTMFGRIARNMATLRQTRLLRRKGVYMPMSKHEATETIGRLMAGR